MSAVHCTIKCKNLQTVYYNYIILFFSYSFINRCAQWKEIAGVIWKRVFEDNEQEEIDIFDAKVGYGSAI